MGPGYIRYQRLTASGHTQRSASHHRSADHFVEPHHSGAYINKRKSCASPIKAYLWHALSIDETKGYWKDGTCQNQEDEAI
jgi:hypothetical protein